MKQKIKKLIKDLKSCPDIDDLDIYSFDPDNYWVFYYNITGFYKDDYFSLSIRKKNNLHIELSKGVTDKPKQLLQFLETITDLKFNLT